MKPKTVDREKAGSTIIGSRKIQISFIVLLVGLFCLSGSLWATDEGKELDDKAKLLRGDLWMKMNADEKVAYIWGVGNVVDLEQELMAIYSELKVENFSAKTAEGIGGVTMNELVAGVDGFYQANPAERDKSVIRVIWDTMIKPNLKTGIGGRPLL